ncbi:hypothetical protein [Escherichia phage AV105]|nr:hypothetical protein [Escherichia phage AV105]
MAKIGASYFETMARALPGQVSDTSAYNIDGACVLEKDDGVPIFVGVAVKLKGVDSMGNKIINAISSAGDNPYGVAVRSHFQTTTNDGRMVYEAGGGINVMTEGRCWMIAADESAPEYGKPIKIKHENGIVDTSTGGIATNWVATGDYTTFGDLKLVEVQVLPS